MMDYNTLIVSILGYLLGAGGLLFWFLERKKFNAEVSEKLEGVNSHRIENDVKLSNHYRELLDDLKKRYEEEFNEPIHLHTFLKLINADEYSFRLSRVDMCCDFINENIDIAKLKRSIEEGRTEIRYGKY